MKSSASRSWSVPSGETPNSSASDRFRSGIVSVDTARKLPGNCDSPSSSQLSACATHEPTPKRRPVRGVTLLEQHTLPMTQAERLSGRGASTDRSSPAEGFSRSKYGCSSPMPRSDGLGLEPNRDLVARPIAQRPARPPAWPSATAEARDVLRNQECHVGLLIVRDAQVL